jgi:uracil phosphoribosyltransferase
MSKNRIIILNHPLIQQKLCQLRDKNTSHQYFRVLLNEISMLMVYETTRNVPVIPKTVMTPLEKTTGYVLSCPVTIVPILRAGLAMCDGILNLIPGARVGHLGFYRDKKTHEPVEYYRKLPVDFSDSEIFVVDPMLATGGSALAALNVVKEAGGKSIKFVCIVAVPEGVRLIHEYHPDVPVYTASLDRELNKNKYILPGLGDAGDRVFGTA